MPGDRLSLTVILCPPVFRGLGYFIELRKLNQIILLNIDQTQFGLLFLEYIEKKHDIFNIKGIELYSRHWQGIPIGSMDVVFD